MKHFFKEKKVVLILSLIIGSFIVSSIVLGAGTSKFGGKITATEECTCSDGSQVTITGYPASMSGTYLYSSSTQRKGKANVTSGRLIIGKYSSGGECLITGDPCTELPITKGTMTVISTN